MIDPAPRWQYVFRSGMSDGFPRLLPDRVVGPWYCLDRATGALLWRRHYTRPNTITGIAQDVIIATEWRMDSPVVMVLGVYAISLETGKLLWVSHGNGWWGRFVRSLDYVFDFANEFRDTPLVVRSSDVVTREGRVLDLQTGRHLYSLDPDQLRKLDEEPDDAGTTWFRDKGLRIDCGGRGVIHGGSPEQALDTESSQESRPGVLFLEDRQGNVAWVFDAAQEDASIDPHSLGMRFLDPYLYMTAYAPIRQPTPTSRMQRLLWEFEPSVRPLPEIEGAALWVLDTRTGKVVQRVPMAQAAYGGGIWISDGDAADLLVSYRLPKSYHLVIECFARE